MVVFDLDHTLVNCDSFARFNRSLLLRQWWRVSLALLLGPALAPLFATTSTRIHALSFLIWLGTVGLTLSELEHLMDEHVASEFSSANNLVCATAFAAFRAHQAAGARMVIATGAVAALAQRVCLGIGLRNFVVVGSTLRPCLGGWIAQSHCFGRNKVRMLVRAGLGNSWDWAYSDSSSDVPLLACARTRLVVNPKPRHLRRFQAAFGSDFATLD